MPDPMDIVTPRPPAPPVEKSWARPAMTREKRRFWVVLTVVLVCLSALAGFRVVRAILRGRSEANMLLGELHDRMRSRDWDGIYRESGWKYRSNISGEDSRLLYVAIDRKLGSPGVSTQEGSNVNVNGTGSYITASFDTEFSGGTRATETVIWQSYGGDYRLISYSINSLALITK